MPVDVEPAKPQSRRLTAVVVVLLAGFVFGNGYLFGRLASDGDGGQNAQDGGGDLLAGRDLNLRHRLPGPVRPPRPEPPVEAPGVEAVAVEVPAPADSAVDAPPPAPAPAPAPASAPTPAPAPPPPPPAPQPAPEPPAQPEPSAPPIEFDDSG